jgi:hypothetical protein
MQRMVATVYRGIQSTGHMLLVACALALCACGSNPPHGAATQAPNSGTPGDSVAPNSRETSGAVVGTQTFSFQVPAGWASSAPSATGSVAHISRASVFAEMIPSQVPSADVDSLVSLGTRSSCNTATAIRHANFDGSTAAIETGTGCGYSGEGSGNQV